MNIFGTVLSAACAVAVLIVDDTPASAQSIGSFYAVNGVTVLPNSTNQYVVGNVSSTNNTGFGLNQIYIGTSELENAGFELFSTSLNTNLTGTITVRLAKSANGVRAEAVPSIVLSITQSYTNVNDIFTNLPTIGVAGFFVTSIENTNASTTNLVSLIANRQAPKFGGYPASLKN